MKKYIRVMRIDHWIKQFFILPGCVCSFLLTHPDITTKTIYNIVIGFFATCFIASANYVINEWLDAEFDQYHPTKKNRSVVTEDVKGSIIWFLWAVLTVIGFLLGSLICSAFVAMEVLLWLMGLLYNVKPFRTKDVPILDVLSESLNNAIRLLLGGFIISSHTILPCSIILGYWMAGAFLMAIKRYAEYRMIADPSVAGKYRASFRFYSEKSLLICSFFYAMCSVFFLGIFLIKYRIELILFVPPFIGLYCYYFWISFKEDSAVQKPEKLYGERGLMFYCVCLIILFFILMCVDIPALNIFISSELISI